MNEKSEKYFRLGLWATALVVQVITFAFALVSDAALFDDSVQYLTLAHNISDGAYSQSYVAPFTPDVQRPPGYPFFLWVTGGGVFTLIIQRILLLLSARYIYKAAGLLFSKRAAHYALLLYLIQPYPAWFAGTILTETLFIFLLTYAFYKLIKYIQNDKSFDFFFSIIALACAVYVKTLALMLFPVWLGAVLLLRPKETSYRILFGRIGGALIFALLLWAPWTYRNYVLTGRATLSTLSDFAVWYGKNGAVLASAQSQEASNTAFYLADSVAAYKIGYENVWVFTQNEQTQENARLSPEASDFKWQAFSAYPLATIKLHLTASWRIFIGVGWGTAKKISESSVIAFLSSALQSLTQTFIFFSAAGWLILGRAGAAQRIAFVTAVVLILAHASVWADGRYRLPADPFILLLAVAFLDEYVFRADQNDFRE